MKLIQNKYVSHSVRILIGCVFIASAVLKYIAIDVFDLYIYEHALFNLNLTATLTRLLIAAECALGILLITNIYIRFTYIITFLFLIGFTIYLVLQPFLFDVSLENCYCFGDKIVLNHTQSIVKNIILMLFLLLININFYKKKSYEFWIFILIACASMFGFMLISAPDYLYSKIHDTEVRIDVPLFDTALKSTGRYEDFIHGRKIVCMYSDKCKYCKKSASKLDKIMKQNQIDESYMKCVFWNLSDSTHIHAFYKDNRIEPIDYVIFPVDTFLTITKGKMPLILFLEEGCVKKSVNYTGISEKEIKKFLQL